jgi:hypothetical protein
MIRKLGAVVTAALIAVAGNASAEATFTLTLHATVPVICHVSFQSDFSQDANGTEQLGSDSEMCNSATGYRVIADYSPTSGAGSIVVDGQQVPLDGSGSVVIAVSDGPAVKSRNIAYVPGDQPVTDINVRVVPT